MLSNDQLRQLDKTTVWHAFTQMAEYEPFIVERAEGCTLYDIDGNAYLDGVSSLWCNVHGHRHPTLDAAIVSQLGKIAHFTNLGGSNPTTIELARRVAEITPAGLNHVFFSDSGATAVEIALKMAFQYWQQCESPQPEKIRYMAFGEAYHGDTIGSVSVGGISLFHQIFHPLLFEAIRLPRPDTYRLPKGVSPETACSHYLGEIETLLEQHHAQTAAIIIEPLMQGAAGMIKQPAGFLKGLRELATKYNVLLIADEVAVGYGRTGKMFACEHEDVSPDVICLGKGITGGYLPLAATVATTEIFNAFLGSHAESKTFFHGHTYGGNPLAAAVACATLDVFAEEQTLAHLPEKIARIESHLARIAEHPQVGSIRQMGMMVGIELVKDKATREPYDWTLKMGAQVCNAARKHGVWLRPLGNVVILMPPLAMKLEELDQVCHAAEAGIQEVLG